MRWLLAALVLLAAGDASAIALKGNSRATITVHAKYTYRKVRLCLLGDLQNLTSQNDQNDNTADQSARVFTCKPFQNSTDPTLISQATAAGCAPNAVCCGGAFCEKSPYCDQNWGNTGQRLLRNIAYDVTGQWEKIDLRGIHGTDDVPETGTFNPPDHGRCDAILSLGDMTDIADSVVALDPNYADLRSIDAIENAQRQIDVNTDFWRIVDASGIPYVTTIGNHDPNQPYVDLMTTKLSFSGKSFYYDKSANGLAYAIKFHNNTGKDICAISVPYGVGSSIGLRPDEAQWANTVDGCGATLPTILVSHYNQMDLRVFTDDSKNICGFLTGASQPLFMFTFGHDTSIGGSTTLKHTAGESQTCGAGAFTLRGTYYQIFANWQELDRHGFPGNYPFGNVPSDSAGGFYRVCDIDPRYSTLICYDYSPYWFSRTAPANVGVQNTTYKDTFDWDTRYCGGSPC